MGAHLLKPSLLIGWQKTHRIFHGFSSSQDQKSFLPTMRCSLTPQVKEEVTWAPGPKKLGAEVGWLVGFEIWIWRNHWGTEEVLVRTHVVPQRYPWAGVNRTATAEKTRGYGSRRVILHSEFQHPAKHYSVVFGCWVAVLLTGSDLVKGTVRGNTTSVIVFWLLLSKFSWVVINYCMHHVHFQYPYHLSFTIYHEHFLLLDCHGCHYAIGGHP